MRSDTRRTDSLWMATALPRVLPPLAEDLRTDVGVVGAGIAGLTTAYLLALEGRRVVVLDDGAVGGGETGRTTAHLATALDDRYSELERLHGAGRRAARRGEPRRGHRPDRGDRRRRGDRLRLQRLDGYLFVPPGESPDDPRRGARGRAARRAAGTCAWCRARRSRLRLGALPALPPPGPVPPAAYLRRAGGAIERRGGRIFSGTHVTGVEAGPPAVVSDRARPHGHRRRVVVATNTPINDWSSSTPSRRRTAPTPSPRGCRRARCRRRSTGTRPTRTTTCGCTGRPC